MLTSQDGYRIRYMMAGMHTTHDTVNDTEAICLSSVNAGGAMCAGITVTAISPLTYAPWAEWHTTGNMAVSAASNIVLVDGIDQSTDWFMMSEDGGNDVSLN